VNAGLVFVPEFLPVFVHDGSEGRRKSGVNNRQLPKYPDGSALHTGRDRVQV
jgi:hypothetical protein